LKKENKKILFLLVGFGLVTSKELAKPKKMGQ
jgi:hypothetical protein